MTEEIRKEVNWKMIELKWNCSSDWGVLSDRIYVGDTFGTSNMIFETTTGYLILRTK